MKIEETITDTGHPCVVSSLNCVPKLRRRQMETNKKKEDSSSSLNIIDNNTKNQLSSEDDRISSSIPRVIYQRTASSSSCRSSSKSDSSSETQPEVDMATKNDSDWSLLFYEEVGWNSFQPTAVVVNSAKSQNNQTA